ncbi:MAG: hypothetical protein IK048_02975 [Clostridia bacterium]|nr:hypothetical protein [Clostridia bacterium]
MNRKLKKYAERQLETCENQEFLNELKAKQRENAKSGKNRKRIISILVPLASTVIAAVVVLLCVFLIKPVSANNQERQYQLNLEDMYSTSISLDTLNNEMTTIEFSEKPYAKIDKYFDNKSNNFVFYYIEYVHDDEVSVVDFQISSDPQYKEFIDKPNYNKQGVVAGKTIDYFESFTVEDEIYFFKVIGAIVSGQEIIYIEADLIALDENSGFIELLNDIVSAK